MSSSTNVLDVVTSIGAIATPILLIFVSGIGWIIQNRMQKSQKIEDELRQRAHKLEEELRDDRLQVYNEILEPFIIMLTKDEALARDKNFRGKDKAQIAQEKILSLSYKQAAFRLSLFADDRVVRAYNELMQFFYELDESKKSTGESDSGSTVFRMMDVFGGLLLAIRKSVGNDSTKLQNFEMLEWMISDIRKMKPEN